MFPVVDKLRWLVVVRTLEVGVLTVALSADRLVVPLEVEVLDVSQALVLLA